MRRLMHYLAMLIPCLMLITACGGGISKEEVEANLANTRKKVQAFESRLSPGDSEGLDLVEICREKIVLASRVLVEGDAEKSKAILDEINFNLDRYMGNIKGAEKIKTFEIFGSVKYENNSGEWLSLTTQDKLEAVKKFDVAGRSGLRMHLFKNTKIFLNSQTSVQVTAYDGKAKRLLASLDNGEVVIEKAKGDGVIEIEMSKYKFVISEDCHAEFRCVPLVNSVYVSVFEGSMKWVGQGGSGSLFRYDAFRWKDYDATLIQIPAAPDVMGPEHESKVGIDLATGEATVPFRWRSNTFVENYHLQVSESPQFITRVYDNQRINRSRVDVNLPKGTYFWRVRPLSKTDVPGAFTKTTELHVGVYENMGNNSKESAKTSDIPGPKLTNLDYNLIGMTVIVSGKTQPGIRVNVNGVAAVLDEDGSFQAIVNFDGGGEQVVRIMAMNPETGGETILDKKVQVN